ncbi:peroxin-1 [Cryptococcus neoformans]|nr:peroxin-1 [Cryptococcus neoformans var. grubii]
MVRKAAVKYRSLRSNLVNLPLSLYAQLVQQQARPQSLILHLSPLLSPSFPSSSRQPKTAYLGWSGLNAAANVSQVGDGVESVEVDPEVAMSLGWNEGILVEIAVVHNPTVAKSVSVTPMSPDDWEILEQHASFLENNLLSQLRAAQKGQEIDVWVMGRTKIRIRVDETNPSSNSQSAVIIKPDTEIYVAPRPRLSKSTSSIPSSQYFPQIVKSGFPNGRNKFSQVKLRLIPPKVTSTWGIFVPPSNALSKTEDERIAVCSPTSLEKIKRRLGTSDGEMFFVKIALDQPLEEESPPPGPVAIAQEKEPMGEAEMLLVSWEEMPNGCLSVAGKTEDWMNVWARVKILGSTGKREKTKSGKGRPVPDLSFSAYPKQTSSPLPGLDKICQEAIDYLRLSAFSQRSKPLLLLGAKGSGKTSLAKIVGNTLEENRFILAETIYEDVGKLDPESRIATIKQNMDKWIEDAKMKAPCCLILDDLDNLLSPETELKTSTNPSILAEYFTSLISSHHSLPPGTLMIATAQDTSTLHPLLNTRHVFGETLKIPPLSKEVRQDILKEFVAAKGKRGKEGWERGEDVGDGLDYVLLGSMTEGYSVSDLSDLVQGATQQAIIRCTKSEEIDIRLTFHDFMIAHEEFTPLSLRGISLQISDVKWSDIGGLKGPRQILRETLEWPTKYAQIFANCPLRLRSGLLLYGYPGCGKTLLASAVAKECGLNFISVKGPEILNKYIGASEKSVRDLFERASGAKPCVLFFDEFDSIAPKRGHDSTGVTDRVVNQLLTEMDGAQGLSGVYVLAATSRPDLIDPALLRPGRLDKSIICDMPSTSDRLEIMKAVVKKGKLELGEDVDLEVVARESEGFSGADLQALVYNAHLEVVHAAFEDEERRKEEEEGGKKVAVNGLGGREGYRLISQTNGANLSAAARAELGQRIDTIVSNSQSRFLPVEKGGRTAKDFVKPIIQQRHLMNALLETRPSVSQADRRRLDLIYRSFVNDRDGKMGNGDLGRETGTRVSLM